MGWKFAPYCEGLNKKPDIIVLSEIRFNETNIDNLPGYKAFNSIRAEKRVVDSQFFGEMIYAFKL